MRKLILGILVMAGLGAGVANAAETVRLEDFAEQSRAKVKAFAVSLQGALKAALEEGGAGRAIEVCNVAAPEIARELSMPPDWTVARTSHKLRNPANAPDDWESSVLQDFLARAAAGESLKTMERAERVEDGGRETYRYMKAIPVGQVCLTCHGGEIAPDLKTRIEAFYPDDRATGFALGSLRGAFTVTRSVQD